MPDLGPFAARLAEATDVSTAAEQLAEFLRLWVIDGGPPEGAAVRVYIHGQGDRCATCSRRATCPTQDTCLHLSASMGGIDSPPAHDQRIPRVGTVWGEVFGGDGDEQSGAIPPELAPPDDVTEPVEALLVRMESGGETVGLVGIRGRRARLKALRPTVRVAAFLTASAIRLLRSLGTSNRRFEQLLLVNELGRKVNSILNDELLLRQAAVDIHRTFGFHNVMIFMVDEDRTHLELKAQASTYAAPPATQTRVELGEGVVGRVYRTGRTEIVDDVARESDYLSWYSDTKSEMAVSIQNGGVVEGVLNIESDRTGAFGPSDRLVLETVANQLAIAIENARLFSMVKEREDRYRTLVESSPGSVLHLDAEGRVIYANPAVSDMTGFEKSHILSRLGSLEDLALESDRTKLREAISAALRGVPCRDLEFHISHADGGVRWLTASLQPLIGEHGDPKGVVVLARDQTLEKELQDRLNQSEKLSAIGTLVSGVAHELNNPLAGVLGFAQLLLARPTEEWARSDVEKIEQNARRCQRIVENLLAFARQSRMTKRRANINEVIESVLNLNEYQFRMDNVEITRDFDAAIPAFPIDVHRWQQVFINLASNAHQALVQSKAAVKRIHFETRLNGPTVLIRVQDTGPGIPEALRNRIFEPFFTTKESGTGLGLGICFGIIEEHGGTIALDPAVEDGTAFVIEVPRDSEAHVLPERPAPAGEMPTDVGSGKHVLVVDDDLHICDVVTRLLQSHLYRTTVANDARSALDKISGNGDFDVVLTDVRMPGELDGIGLYDELRRVRPDLARRFIFMTGNLLDTRTMDRLGRLAVRCIEKPFDIHELARVVNDVSALGGKAEAAD